MSIPTLSSPHDYLEYRRPEGAVHPRNGGHRRGFREEYAPGRHRCCDPQLRLRAPPREHAPLVLRENGVSCVIASSFARIFYRNAINIGLPILECEAAANGIDAGDEVEVDFDTGVITDVTKGESWQAAAFPPFIQNIIKAGGLLKSLKEREA